MDFCDSDKASVTESLLGLTLPPIERDLYESDLSEARELLTNLRSPLIDALKNARDFNKVSAIQIARRLHVKELDENEFKQAATQCIIRASEELAELEGAYRQRQHLIHRATIMNTLQTFTGSSTAASTILQEFIRRELPQFVTPRRTITEPIPTNPRKVISKEELRARASGKGTNILIKLHQPSHFAGLRYKHINLLNRTHQTNVTILGEKGSIERMAKANFASPQCLIEFLNSKHLKGVKDTNGSISIKLATPDDEQTWTTVNIARPVELKDSIAEMWNISN